MRSVARITRAGSRTLATEMAALAALAALVRRHDGAVNGSRPEPATGEA